MFARRLGPAQKESLSGCDGTYGCADIWELDDGDFAVIGADITEHANKLPASAGCAPTERIVRIPRKLLVLAKPYIPESL